MRHPIFFAFFLMIWVVPQMTWGRLLVAVFWSIYLVVGTLRKESKLMRNHAYKKYISEVGAYPFFPKRPFRSTFKWGKL